MVSRDASASKNSCSCSWLLVMQNKCRSLNCTLIKFIVHCLLEKKILNDQGAFLSSYHANYLRLRKYTNKNKQMLWLLCLMIEKSKPLITSLIRTWLIQKEGLQMYLEGITMQFLYSTGRPSTFLDTQRGTVHF